MILALPNKSLQAGAFPAAWKRQKLVLIPKGKGGDPMIASSHRPLGMLGNLEKLYERKVLTRLEVANEETGGMAPMLFGFGRGLSTLQAVKVMQNAIERAANMQSYPGGFCWERVYEAFNGQVTGYLLAVVSDYFRDRKVVFDTDKGRREIELSAGVAQGSVSRPFDWNAQYDGVLNLDLAGDATLVGFADDIAQVASLPTRRSFKLQRTSR